MICGCRGRGSQILPCLRITLLCNVFGSSVTTTACFHIRSFWSITYAWKNHRYVWMCHEAKLRTWFWGLCAIAKLSYTASLRILRELSDFCRWSIFAHVRHRSYTVICI
jgi:hypothetical protein